MSNYYLLNNNNQFFIRYQDNVPYIYVVDASGTIINVSCWSGVNFCSDWGGFLNNSSYISSVPTSCTGTKVFTNNEFKGESLYYRVPWQTIEPASSEISNLCNGYNLNFSKKIKITIDDPIFSGVYVFDYNSNLPKVEDASDVTTMLIPGQWDLNLSESSIKLSKHPCSSGNIGGCSYYNDKYLISLDVITDSSVDGVQYPGYYEHFYNGYDPDSRSSANSAYAFPANIIMTAIQPPEDSGYPKSTIDCNGPGFTGIPQPTGIGHRMVAAFKTPIRYRRGYNDWIVVDKIPMTISGLAPNYVTSFVSGSVSISGTSASIDPDLIIRYDPPPISMSGLCDRVVYSGTAFKVAGTGLGLIGGPGGAYAGFPAFPTASFNGLLTHGLGRYNNFTDFLYGFGYWNGSTCVDGASAFGSTNVTIPWSRWFGPKQPLKATIEFVHSCRNNFPQCSGTLSPVNSISYSYTGTCVQFWGSNIDTDYYCSNQSLFASSGTIGTFENVNIIYSGFYNSGVSSAYYVGIASGFLNNIVNIYQPVNITGSQVISIPYTGINTIGAIRNWIYRSVGVYLVPLTGGNSGIPSIKHNTIDLFTSASGTSPNRTLTARIFLGDYLNNSNGGSAFSDSLLRITDASVSGANGFYQYYATGGNGDNTPQYLKVLNSSGGATTGSDTLWTIRLINCNNPYNTFTSDTVWQIGSGLSSSFTEYYRLVDADASPWSPPWNVPNSVVTFSGVQISYGNASGALNKPAPYYI